MAKDIKAATQAINKAQKELSAARIAESADRLANSASNALSNLAQNNTANVPANNPTVEPMLNQLQTAQQQATPSIKVGRPTRARTPVSNSKGIAMAN